jgi:3-oxoadipate CoA-transferase alpha subunit
MCMAAARTIVQVSEVVEAGALDPEHIVTPGIFVDHLVEVGQPIQEEELVAQGVVYP